MPEMFYCQMTHRSLVRVRGKDCGEFLQNLLSNDISTATTDKAVYALLLTPQGKFLFDLFVIKTEEGFCLDCERQNRSALIDKLNLYKMRADVVLEPDEREIHFCSSAPTAAAAAPSASLVVEDPRRYPQQDPFGWRVIGAAPPAPRAAPPAAVSVYHKRRIAFGIAEAGIELTPERFPLECNLDELGAIDFNKGCFIGQEVTSRMKRLGGGGRKKLMLAQGAALEQGSLYLDKTSKVGVLLSISGAQGLALIRTDKLGAARFVWQGEEKIEITPLI